MRKTKKILGCIGICALSLSMAFGAMGVKNTKTVKAEETWTTNTDISGILKAEGGTRIQTNMKLPAYMLARTVNGNAPGAKLWRGSDYGTLVTFAKSGDKDYVELKDPVKVSDLKTVASFISVPSEATWAKSQVDFESLICEIIEVDDGGNEKQNPKKVYLKYHSGAGYSAALASKLDGVGTAEVSAYLTAKSSYYEGEELKEQNYYAYANDGKTYNGRDGAVSEAPGTPRALDGGVVGISCITQGSSKDVRTPFVFRYFEENRTDANGAYVYSYAVADTVKDSSYQKIRAFSDSRNYKDAYPDLSDEDAVKKGFATSKGSVDNGIKFPGFGADTKVKVRMYINAFSGGSTSAQIMLFNVAEKDTFNHVNIKADYDGVMGSDFVMPDFDFVERKTNVASGKYSESFTTVTKKATDCGENLFAIKITPAADGGETKTDMTVADGKFTPDEARQYGLVYKYGGYQQATRITVSETLKAPAITGVTRPASTAETFVADYVIAAEAESSIYRDGAVLPDIDVTLLKHDGTDYNTVLKTLNIGDALNLKQLSLSDPASYGLGKYRVKYSFTDVLGRTAVQNVDFDYNADNRSYACLLNGVEGEAEPYYYGLEGGLTVSARDVYCYDILAGANFATPVITITDGANEVYTLTSELSFEDYLSERKNLNKAVFGKYVIKYAFDNSDPVFTKSVIREVNVIDCVAPVISPATESYVYGAKVDKEKTKTKDTVYFTAIKGSELIFENIVAYDNVGEKYDLTNDVKLTVFKPDGQKDEAVTYDPQNFKYTVKDAGEYIFRFTAKDSVTLTGGVQRDNLEAVLVYVVDVSENFYTVKLLSEYGVKDTATSFKVADFTVTDFYGTPANANKTVKAFDENGEEVWTAGVGEVKNFTGAGVYTIKHVATVGGQTAGEIDVKVEIVDKTKPVIVIKGDIYKKTVVGREITVVEADANDNAGIKSLVTDVTLNGNIINVYGGKFTPISAGEYVVKITATDVNDNVSVYEYVITVEQDKVGGFANFMNRFGLVFAIVFGVLAAGGAAAFVLLKKNKLVKKQDKGE